MIRQQSNPVLVPDNKSGAYVVREKPNGLNYIDIDTVDGSEKIDFGNVTTNPEYNLLGSGVLTVNGGLAMAANADIVLSATSELTLNGLTPSLPIFTDSSNNVVSNTITGSGNVVMSASPTLTGTVSGASLTLSGSINIGATTTITGILDDDTMSANSASDLVTQQSIKAYVDNNALDDSDYILVDGTRSLTGNWGVGGFDLDNVGNITIAANKDLLGSASSDINFGSGNFTVSGLSGDTQTGRLTVQSGIPWVYFKDSIGTTMGQMYHSGYLYITTTTGNIALIPDGVIEARKNIELYFNSDLIGAISSDINFGSGNFTVSGSTGNTKTGNLLINSGTYITSFIDDDTMSANSSTSIVSQQSLVAYVGSEISSAVITDHGALTGLGDDDHTQYALVSGVRDFTGQVGINATNPALYFKEGGVTKGSISESGDHLIVNAVTNSLYLLAASDLIMDPTGDIEAEADIVLGNTYDLRGSTSSDIDFGNGKFTVSGASGNTQTGELYLDASIPYLKFKNSGVTNGDIYTLSGGETYWYSHNNDITIIPNDTVNLDGHLSIMSSSNLLMSSSSSILGTTYSIAGATGNMVSSGSLTLGGNLTISKSVPQIWFSDGGTRGRVRLDSDIIYLESYYSSVQLLASTFVNIQTALKVNNSLSINTILDDDSMSANSASALITQQSLVAYVGSEISSAVITDHGALTGLGDDDHTQYVLANGSRNITGALTIEDSLTLKHTYPITYFRNDADTLLGSVGNLAAGDMRLKCDTSHINIIASTYVAIQSDLYVNSDLTMGTGRDIIGTSSGFLDWAGDATIGGDFKTGSEIGWQTSSEIECGAGYSSSSSANSNRYNLSGKSFVVTNPTASRWYGFSGMVEKTVYEVINESTGAEAAVILEPSGTTARFTVVSEGRVSFLYYAGKMWVL